MSDTSKSRTTRIIAHCGPARLIKAFPDKDEKKTTIFYPPEGGKRVGEISGHPGEYASEQTNLTCRFAKEAGYALYFHTEEITDQSWIQIGSMVYNIQKLGERKTAIVFKTYNEDEEAHYEKVDEIVRQLALKDIAVLRGNCEITITTKC